MILQEKIFHGLLADYWAFFIHTEASFEIRSRRNNCMRFPAIIYFCIVYVSFCLLNKNLFKCPI